MDSSDNMPAPGRYKYDGNLFLDIAEFHTKFGLEYNGGPRDLPQELQEFRTQFMEEELEEYRDALAALGTARAAGNEEAMRYARMKAFDALVDLAYVTLGTAYLHGFRFNEGWRRVHKANMAKVRARPDGVDSKRGSHFDVVKPEGWEAPDYEDLV